MLFYLRDNVAYISRNRPKNANTLTEAAVTGLYEAIVRCKEDHQVRAVLLSGKGKRFCAGAEVSRLAQDDAAVYLESQLGLFHKTIQQMLYLEKPIVAAVHGAAAGAGFSLMAASDIVIAAESTRFVAAYARLGVTPDGGLSYLLPRLIGTRRTLELILTNRSLTAKEAADWGLVNEVISDDLFLERAEQLANELAQGPTLAFGAAKRLVTLSWTENIESQLQLELRTILDRIDSEEAKDGMRAFLEKRKPDFI